jgi:hypothetical protein
MTDALDDYFAGIDPDNLTISVIPGQLTLDPIWPKQGSVKAAVLNFILARPDGSCRRDFAEIDVYEVSARIGELQKDGWQISNRPCSRHQHRPESHFVEYSL